MKTKTFELFINEKVDSKFNIDISIAAESAWLTLNTLNLLMDKGYIDKFGRWKDGIKMEDVNEFLEGENVSKFSSSAQFNDFLQQVKIACKTLANKID